MLILKGKIIIAPHQASDKTNLGNISARNGAAALIDFFIHAIAFAIFPPAPTVRRCIYKYTLNYSPCQALIKERMSPI